VNKLAIEAIVRSPQLLKKFHRTFKQSVPIVVESAIAGKSQVGKGAIVPAAEAGSGKQKAASQETAHEIHSLRRELRAARPIRERRRLAS